VNVGVMRLWQERDHLACDVGGREPGFERFVNPTPEAFRDWATKAAISCGRQLKPAASQSRRRLLFLADADSLEGPRIVVVERGGPEGDGGPVGGHGRLGALPPRAGRTAAPVSPPPALLRTL
jgi:hypothetical protein